MIHLRSVTKTFGTRSAVQSVDLTIGPGEIVGFLGVNGAGKTTTMRLLTGVYAPTNGVVTVFGKQPTSSPTEVARHIGYLPENNPLYLDMLVSEYLAFIANTKERKEYSTVAEEVGLADRLSSKIASLSRGYRQRVGLAASLIGSPDVLILDEPTSGLDPIEQEKIKAVIKRHAQGKMVIFSTHILSEAYDIATRIVMIHMGKKVYDGEKPATLIALEDLFKTKVSESIII